MRLRAQFNAAALRWIEAEEGRFVLFLPVAAIAGDAAYFALRAEPWPGIAPLLLLLGAALARIPQIAARATGLSLAFFAAGFLSAQFAALRAPPFPALPAHAVALAGRIAVHDTLPEGARLTIAAATIDGRPIGPRRLRIRTPDDPAYAEGAEISVRARLSPPPPPAYPGANDGQRDAWFSNSGGYGYALGDVRVTRAAPPSRLASLRDRIAGRVEAVLPGPRGAIAATLVTGKSAAIPEDDRAAFVAAGLAHLLAIAGLHLGIVMGLAYAVLRWTILRSERLALRVPANRIAAIGSLCAGGFYLALTGAHVPTLRGFAMAAIVVLALLTGRRAAALRAWGIAALLVIAIAPAEVMGVSFQLSFAAVLALIAGYAALRGGLNRLRGGGGWGRHIAHHAATLALTSALAGTASLPVVAAHFSVIQLYFILANLIAVPITAVLVMPAGLAALALMPFGLDRIALIPMGWGITALLRIAHTVAAWPGATIATPHIPLISLAFYAAGLGWLCLWRSHRRFYAAVPMLAALLAAILMPLPDVLISPDARLIALRDRASLLTESARGGDTYILAQWTQYLAAAARPIDPQRCDPGGCRIALPHVTVRLGNAQSPCDAAILIAQSGALPYCPHRLEIDREFIWRNGATAITRHNAVTDRQSRGPRPWLFLGPEQQRTALTLPLAAIER